MGGAGLGGVTLNQPLPTMVRVMGWGKAGQEHLVLPMDAHLVPSKETQMPPHELKGLQYLCVLLGTKSNASAPA